MRWLAFACCSACAGTELPPSNASGAGAPAQPQSSSPEPAAPAPSAPAAPAQDAGKPDAAPEPEEDGDAFTPIAKQNRERLTDPKTGKRYFQNDLFNLDENIPLEEPRKPSDSYWALEVQPGVRVEDDVVVGKYCAVFVTPAAVLRGPEQPFRVGHTEQSEVQENLTSVVDRTFLFDYDGDAVPELIHAVEFGLHTRAGWVRRARIYTKRGDRVTLYPPTKNLTIEMVVDFDDDGRPDLWLEPKGGKKGATVAARSLPNGSFSTTDPIARKATREAR